MIYVELLLIYRIPFCILQPRQVLKMNAQFPVAHVTMLFVKILKHVLMEFVNAEIKIPVELLVNNASLEHVCVELHQAAKARAQARFAILKQVSANVHKTLIPVQTEWNVTTVIAVMV